MNVEVHGVVPTLDDSKTIIYGRGAIEEHYIARDETFEQRFVIPRRLNIGEEADLILTGEVRTAGRFEERKHGWAWTSEEGSVHLSDVVVYDRDRKRISAQMTATPDSTEIWVDGEQLARAVYPATIDPVLGVNDFRISDNGNPGQANTQAFETGIAFNATHNEFLVVFQGDETGDTRDEIYGQLIDAETGAEIGVDFFISDMPSANTGRDSIKPKVAWNSTKNEYLVVFIGDMNNGLTTATEVFAQRVSNTGALLTAAGVDNSGTAAPIRISDMGALDTSTGLDAFDTDVAYNNEDDEYLVVWTGDDEASPGGVGDTGGDDEVFGQLLDYSGSTLQEDGTDFRISEVGISGDNVRALGRPPVVFNPTQDEYLVCWAGEEVAAGQTEIQCQRLNKSGVEQGSDFTISDLVNAGTNNNGGTLIDEARAPHLAYNSTNNEYLCVWEGETGANTHLEIMGQRLTNIGTETGTDDFLISDMGGAGNNTSFPADNPVVAYNPKDNEYLVVWFGEDNANGVIDNEQEVSGQFLSNTGGAIGNNDFLISNTMGLGSIPSTLQTPFVSYTDTGLNSYLAAWAGSDDSNNINDLDIFGHMVEPVLEVTKTLVTSPSTGVDAFDKVRYQIDVNHKQTTDGADTVDISLDDAFNVTLSDTLPIALTSLTIVSAQTSNDGFSTTIDVSSEFEIATGVLQTKAGANVDLLHGSVNGTDHTALRVVMEGTVADTVQPGDTITANTATIGWTNHNPGLVHPEYNDSSTTPSIAPVPASFGVSKAADVANVTIGETITYEATVTLIEGTTNNLQFVDTLPLGTTYVAASAGVSSANGMTISPLMVTGPVGQVLTIDIASVVNPGNVDNAAVADTDDFKFTYQVTVDYDPVNVQDGTDLINDLDASADNGGGGSLTDNNNSFTVGVQAGTIIIAKTTTPAGGTGFGFDSSDGNFPAAVVNSFTLDDTDTTTIAHLPVPLDYDVIEDDPTVSPGGFALTNIVCTGENGGTASTVDIPNRKATINLDDGETVTCTFTNMQLGTINIVKDTVPNAAQDFSFIDNIAAPNAFSLDDDADGTLLNTETFTNVAPGTFSVTEAAVAGYSTTVSCADPDSGSTLAGTNVATIDLDAGETITCTFTNTLLGTINIVKDTVPNAAQDFSFTDDIAAPNAFSLDDDADGTLLDTETFTNVAPGTFMVTEAAVAGYSTTVSCADPDSGSTLAGTNVATIDLDAGETITCTFINTLGPDLAVTKSQASPVGNVPAGTNVTYDITVTNNNPADATAATVTDTLPLNLTRVSASSTEFSCPGSVGDTSIVCTLNVTLGNGDSGTITIVAAVPASQAAGQVTNSATVSAVTPPDANSANDTGPVMTDIVNVADLVITKTDDVDPSILVGNNITYTIMIANNGPSDAPNVIVSDMLPVEVTFVSITPSQGACSDQMPPGLQCELGTIAASGNASITLVATAQTAGSAVNMASVTSDATEGNAGDESATETTTILDVVLSIAKTAQSPPFTAGGNETYVITVNNSGGATANGVVVSDILPAVAGVGFVSAVPNDGSSCAEAAGTVTCNLNPITGGGSVMITVTISLAGDIADLTSLTNQFSVTATEDPTGDNGSIQTLVDNVADLVVTKTGPPDPVLAGSQIVYTVTVLNNGPSTALNVVATDTLPVEVGSAATSDCAGDPNGVPTCTLGNIASGDAVQYTITGTVQDGFMGNISNSVTVGSSSQEGNAGDETDTHDNEVVDEADLEVAKTQTSPAGDVRAGETVTYTITVTNNGPAGATGATVTDVLPASLTRVSAASAEFSCPGNVGDTTITCTLNGTLANGASGTITVVAAVPASQTAGQVTNAATVSNVVPNDNTNGNDTGMAMSNIVREADLLLDKTAAPTNGLVAGQDTVTYTVKVTNNGPATATGVTVADVLTLPAGTALTLGPTPSQGACSDPTPPDITCELGTLTVGGMATITMTVTPDSSAAGKITNSAIVGGAETDPGRAVNQAMAMNDIGASADLSLTKAGDPAVVSQGDSIEYTLVVTNNGPSDAQNVVVSDTLPGSTALLTSSAGCSLAGQLVTCAVGVLGAGDSVSLTIRVRVQPNASTGLTNNAAVTSSSLDPDASNNLTSTTTTLDGATGLSASQFIAPNPLVAGAPATKRITVVNIGPGAATNVVLTDSLPGWTHLRERT